MTSLYKRLKPTLLAVQKPEQAEGPGKAGSVVEKFYTVVDSNRKKERNFVRVLIYKWDSSKNRQRHNNAACFFWGGRGDDPSGKD